MNYKNGIIPIILFLGGLLPRVSAAESEMKPYAIGLPDHVLEISLPDGYFGESMTALSDMSFNPKHPSYLKNGFSEITGALYDFNGPFWVGAYGSLKVHIMVQRKLPEYKSDILSIEELQSYVRWKIGRGKDAKGCLITISSLNEASAVLREWNTFNDPSDQGPEHIKIYSFPLGDETFLDIGFTVKTWGETGRKKLHNWKPKAEALRESIKSTVVLERKN